MNIFGETEKSIAEIASLNLSDLSLWYLGTIGVVLLLIMISSLIGFMSIIYYTAKYRNIYRVKEIINNKLLFRILKGVADILSIYLIALCVPLFLWWIAYLTKTYII